MELFLLYVWMKLNMVPWILIPLIIGVTGYWVWHLIDYHGDYTWHRMWYDLPYRERNNLSYVEWRQNARKMSQYQALFTKLRRMLLVLVFLWVAIPTQTQTAVLVAGHYALRMAESPEAAKVMQLLRQKANEYLDNELKQVKK